jgi:hypothetical protein
MVCALTLAVVVAVSRAAVAQPPRDPLAKPAPESGKSAEGLYKEGVRFYRDKKWAEAESAFRAAWALSPTFDVAYNLGNAEFRQGKYRDAAEHLSFALRVWPLLEATADLRPIAEKRLAEARTFVGALTVKVNVIQAEVVVDGTAVGTSPLPGEVFVAPGTHVIQAKAAGYDGANQTVTIEKGATRTIELSLEATRLMAPPAATSKVRATQAAPTATVGTPAPSEGPSLVVIGVGIGVAVAATAGGIASAVVSNARDDERASLLGEIGGRSACWPGGAPSPRCGEVLDLSAAEKTFRGVSITSFIVAGAALGATLTYVFWPRAADDLSGSARVTVTPNPYGGSLAVTGTF